MRRVAAAVMIGAASLMPVGVPTAQAGPCKAPTVNALTYAESAVSRPAINSPSEIPVSNLYGIVEQATFPEFTYAEAGPQYAGVFEALLPAGTPPPPRAASAYPSKDIPDEDEENWGGVSRTEVTATSALATSAGGRTALGEGSADSSRSWVVTDVKCDVVTVVAGWEANDVTLAPGAFVEQMAQELTLVVGPGGASAEVETSVVGAEGVDVPSEGRPGDPFADPIRENGGPTLDVGEPRTEVGDDFATGRGGGFHVFFGDPETGQGGGYAIGGVVASIDVLGPLSPVSPPSAQGAGPVSRDDLPERPTSRQPVSVGTTSAAVGTPPPPSSEALDTVAAIEAGTITDELVSVVTAQRRNWVPLFGLLGSLGVVAVMAGAVQVGRDDYPTLEWIAQKSSAAGSRFAAIYLRW